MTRSCERCGAPFTPQRDYHRVCWECWRRENDPTVVALTRRISALEAELRRARASLTRVDRRLLRSAVALAHPDRHPPERHDEATETTAALLELMQEAA